MEPGQFHYYGDIVRKLFLAGAVIMLLSMAFFQTLIPVSVLTSTLIILILILGAGLIAPLQKWIIVLNVIVAGASVYIFEYYAVDSYLKNRTSFFVVNELLAIIFLIAFYYVVKTIRSMPWGKRT
jgi:hypothetical protein